MDQDWDRLATRVAHLPQGIRHHPADEFVFIAEGTDQGGDGIPALLAQYP